MAGLGEACSHIAAILFTLYANSEVHKSVSSTSIPCYWLPPTFQDVPFAAISDIDFKNPGRKMLALASSAEPSASSTAAARTTDITPISKAG